MTFDKPYSLILCVLMGLLVFNVGHAAQKIDVSKLEAKADAKLAAGPDNLALGKPYTMSSWPRLPRNGAFPDYYKVLTDGKLSPRHSLGAVPDSLPTSIITAGCTVPLV